MKAVREFLLLRRPTFAGTASVYAVAHGMLMLYGGIGHTIAVISVHVQAGREYDFRFASLLAVGGVLIYGALTNLLLARWLGRGRAWAYAWCAFVTLAVTVFSALMIPLASARDAAGPAFTLNAAFAVFIACGWIYQTRASRPEARLGRDPAATLSGQSFSLR